jgi:SAM-dependent methyltransferase
VAHAYDEFAPYFDAWQEAFGGAYDDLILPRLSALLARHAPGARRVADLGIGTGSLVIALARRGFEVVGVDVSRPMLAVARGKVTAAGLEHAATLVEGDIRDLALEPRIDAAICVYTVVNQLAEDGDLDRLLAGVHRSLVPGGVFVFEVNLPAAYARFWSGLETVQAGAIRIRRAHARLAANLVEARVTIEEADGSVRHDRIVQRAYEATELEPVLARSGFTVADVERFDPFGGAGEPTKALWVAQRRRT